MNQIKLCKTSYTSPKLRGCPPTDLLGSCLPKATITARLSAYTLNWNISLPSLSGIHCTKLWSLETFRICLQDSLMLSKHPCHHGGIQQITSDAARSRQFVTRHCRVITEAARSKLTSEPAWTSFIKSGIKFSKMSFELQLVSLCCSSLLGLLATLPTAALDC